jgi:hypothetical protein
MQKNMPSPKREISIGEYERLFRLSPWWRLILGLIGAASLVVAFNLYHNPPVRESVEVYAAGSPPPDKRTRVPADPSTVVIALITAGVAFLAYAATGIKLSKFEAFGLRGETPPPPGPNENTSADVTPSPTPTPTPAPTPTSTSAPKGVTAMSPRDVQLATWRIKYPALQFGDNYDPAHTFLLRSSWNGLKILKACQVAYHKKRPLKLREVAAIGMAMSYDYAFGFFIASLSANLFVGYADPTTGEGFIYELDPTFDAKITEILQGNVAVGSNKDLVEAKRSDLAALSAYLSQN